jgi:hypothetical protein
VPIADSFHSAWLELAFVGLVTSVGSNALLASSQASKLCAPALSRVGRAAILHATCEASDSGWARVIRAELSGAGTSRVAGEERSRVRRACVIGLAGVAATLSGAAMLMRAQPVVMGLLAVVSLYVAWKLVANARAAIAAVASASRVATGFDAARTSPAEAPPSGDLAPVRVRAPNWIGFVFLAIAALVIAVPLLEVGHPVDAHEIGLAFGAHVTFVPPLLAAMVVLRSASVVIDGARREVRVAHRLIGVEYATTSVPLEIVTGFSVEEKREPRGKDTYLVADTTAGPVRLASGDGARAAATALARHHSA